MGPRTACSQSNESGDRGPISHSLPLAGARDPNTARHQRMVEPTCPHAALGRRFEAAPFPPLRRFVATSAFIALLSPSFAVAEGDDSHRTQPLTDTRREMLEEYKFTPPGSRGAAPPSSLHSDAPASPQAHDSTLRDTVKMAPFEVREAGTPNVTLEPAAVPKSDGGAGRAAARLGIGVHHIEIGKVHVFVNTIFFVPFLVGFDW